jgi:hypothetical protein
MFDYNCAICIKNLSQIHDSVLLVDDEIVTDIIVFDDIPIKECAHIEEISRDIYDCGGLVYLNAEFTNDFFGMSMIIPNYM